MDSNFAEVAARLKAADEALIPLARRNIRAAVVPLPPKIQDSARQTLPKSGGLADLVASSKFTTTTSFIPKTAGVQLRMKAVNQATVDKRARAKSAGKRYPTSPSHDLVAIDQGRLRHPTYGRDPWVTQPVPRGFFSRPVVESMPEIQAAVMAAALEAARVAGFK